MATGGIPFQALKKARAADTLALSQAVFDVLHRPGWRGSSTRTCGRNCWINLFPEPCGLNLPSL
jgi:hypothetical protein